MARLDTFVGLGWDIFKRMTPSQIERAQYMARKCQASNFKQCD